MMPTRSTRRAPVTYWGSLGSSGSATLALPAPRSAQFQAAVALTLAALALLAVPGVSQQGLETAEAAPAYVRTLEGSAYLTPEGDRPSPLELNLALFEGDRIETAAGARAELFLAGGTLVRMEGGTEITLTKMTATAEGQAAEGQSSEDSSTLLTLERGEIQLTTLAKAPPVRVETAFASVALDSGGIYCLAAAAQEGDQPLTVLSRLGGAEIDSAAGRIRLAEGQKAIYEGSLERPRLRVTLAGNTAPLEDWAHELDRTARRSESSQRVVAELGYQAAPLDEYGSWADSPSGGPAWRPEVGDDWQPYTTGYWQETPAGLSWVSNEPWGWVTHHYGSWIDDPAYGWQWYPGAVYSPGWVYWYWGSSHVAWVPIGAYAGGYYGHSGYDYGAPYGYGGHSRYGQDRYGSPGYGKHGYGGKHEYGGGHGYGGGYSGGYGHSGGSHSGFGLSFGFGLRSGLYGWIEADLSLLSDWTFCPTDRFRGARHGDYSSGRRLHQTTRQDRLSRGLLTTDTRALTRARWTQPDEAQRLLLRDGEREAGQRALPDVTSFVNPRQPIDQATRDRVLVRSDRAPTLQVTPAAERPRSGSPESGSPVPTRRVISRDSNSPSPGLSRGARDLGEHRSETTASQPRSRVSSTRPEIDRSSPSGGLERRAAAVPSGRVYDSHGPVQPRSRTLPSPSDFDRRKRIELPTPPVIGPPAGRQQIDRPQARPPQRQPDRGPSERGLSDRDSSDRDSSDRGHSAPGRVPVRSSSIDRRTPTNDAAALHSATATRSAGSTPRASGRSGSDSRDAVSSDSGSAARRGGSSQSARETPHRDSSDAARSSASSRSSDSSRSAASKGASRRSNSDRGKRSGDGG